LFAIPVVLPKRFPTFPTSSFVLFKALPVSSFVLFKRFPTLSTPVSFNVFALPTKSFAVLLDLSINLPASPVVGTFFGTSPFSI
jgi:hypothetical protein